MTKDAARLILPITLAGLAAAVMFVFSRIPMLAELAAVAAVMTGMLLVAALSAMSGYLWLHIPEARIRIEFNEARNRQALDGSIVAERNRAKHHESPQFSPWELTPATLIIEDPALALAKLRIDIEQELRRIAFKRDVLIDSRWVSIRRLVDTLVDREVLERKVAATINDVIPACNLAIHGGQITPETAEGVLSIGQDLLDILRTIESGTEAPAY
jgi:hypothetical protein